jgi:DNA-binding GntR family transcriptional regulator
MASYAIEKSPTLRDQVIEAVLEILQSGTILPGQRVTEEGLARQLNVSRTPIREALGQLAQRGALHVRPGGGYAVPLPTLDELHEIIAVRLLLEPPAVRLAAAEFDAGNIATIDQAIGGEDAAASEKNPLRFAQANERFRRAIFQEISNRALRRAIAQFDTHLHFIRSSTLKNLPLRRQIVDRQRAIRDAIAAHDADLAEGLWKSYLRLTEEALSAALTDFMNSPEAPVIRARRRSVRFRRAG